MKWFGKPRAVAMCDDTPHGETPVGELCGWCGEPIEADDFGVTMPLLGGFDLNVDVTEIHFHYECHCRQIFGGVNHQRGKCICCGGKEPPDPPGMTKREAARAAFVEAISPPHE